MTTNLSHFPSQPANHPAPNFALSRQQQRWLLRGFWGFACLIIFVILNAQADFETTAGALMIASTALFPGYLWCAGKAKGLPIFPALSLTFLATHALPLVSDHPDVVTYLPQERLAAAMATALFLAAGTLIWFPFVRSVPTVPRQYRAFNLANGENFFLFILVLDIFYNYALGTGLFWQLGIGGSAISIIRGFLTLNLLGLFILSYRLGKGELSPRKGRLLIFLLIWLWLSELPGLYLNTLLTPTLLVFAGFTVGRGRIPWRSALIFALLLLFLNLGKSQMRSKYWQDGGPNVSLAPWQYLPEWVGYSWQQLSSPEDVVSINPELDESETEEQFTESFNRASLIHMLLLIQSRTEAFDLPHLNGLTYQLIPQLLVPRILNPNKIRGNTANHLLTVYYGLGDVEYTYTTSIGWGLLQEAYANFGWLGCLGLSGFFGVVYGSVTRWCMHTHILSFRTIWGILIFSTVFATEWTMGTWCSVVFQGSVVLLTVRAFLMRPYWHQISWQPHSAMSGGFLSVLDGSASESASQDPSH